MKKKICCIISFLLTCILLLSCNSKLVNTTQSRKITSHKNNKCISNQKIIKDLTSKEFEGRLVGSNGNKLSEEYINNIFSELNLSFVFDNSYYQKYTQYNGADNYNSKIDVNNIIGKIKGTDSSKAIIISAHFDHIGIINNKLIQGAVDNASGIAILLDLASKLKSEKNINYDIIFCAFNGEEKGRCGSQVFVNNISKFYSNIYNINIDSVGYNKGGNIVLINSYELENHTTISNNNSYSCLYNFLKNSFNCNNLEIVDKEMVFRGDDRSFQEKGYTSVTITEENIWDVIHTENDVETVIDYNRLDKITLSLLHFINNYGTSILQ